MRRGERGRSKTWALLQGAPPEPQGCSRRRVSFPSPCPRTMGGQRLPLSKALPTGSRPRQALHTARRSPGTWQCTKAGQTGRGAEGGRGPRPIPGICQPPPPPGSPSGQLPSPRARGLQGPEHILPGLGNEGGQTMKAGRPTPAALGETGSSTSDPEPRRPDSHTGPGRTQRQPVGTGTGRKRAG